MTDIERVKQMVRDGRITEAEGDQLIAVLETAKVADDELQAAGEEIGAEARAIEAGTPLDRMLAPLPAIDAELTASSGALVAPNEAPELGSPSASNTPPAPNAPSTPVAQNAPAAPNAPVSPNAPAAPVPPVAPGASGSTSGSATGPASTAAPAGTRWVSLQMLAGDLDVVVDDGLEQPEVESDGPVDVIIERSEDGFRVRWDQPSGSFLDKMLGKLRSGNLSLRLPAGYGLDLAATAGDVDLVGVPYLRGHLTAGDLDATGLKGIDFTSRAGDIELEAELTSGSHRINVTAGNVDVRLAPHSSVSIKADASIGDISSRLPDLKPKSRSLGESLEGAFGGGAANLDIAVTTGSIKLGEGRG